MKVTKLIKIRPGNQVIRMVYITGDKYNHMFPAKLIIEGLYHEGIYNYALNVFFGGWYKILFSKDYEINDIIEIEDQQTSLSVPGSCVGTIHNLNYAT